MKYFLPFFISLVILTGCHAKPSGNNTFSDASELVNIRIKLKKGAIIDSVKCLDDSSQIYSLYIPNRYDSTKRFPVIYFFDPHGAGNMPLLFYKDLAEEYGYILAGTYNSKNGMPWSASRHVANELIEDTRQRLSIDNNRMYAFGFSGGARVACALALLTKGIAGVIACGGGFPGEYSVNGQSFSLLSFVGVKDFNLVELKNLDKKLDSSSIYHQLITFNGKHQWPPVTVAEQAFQWLDLCAMRDKLIPESDSLIASVKQGLDSESSKWSHEKNDVKLYFSYKKKINFLRDLTNVDDCIMKAGQLQRSAAMVEYFKNENLLEAQEAQLQNEMIDNLYKREFAWWQQKVSQLNMQIRSDTLSNLALQDQRLLAFLSLASYMGSIHALSMQRSDFAVQFLTLYSTIDPLNPEHSYLFACLYARENNNKMVISNLQDAVKLGFSDLRRIKNDSNFVSLRNQPAFENIIKQIASMPAKLDLTQ